MGSILNSTIRNLCKLSCVVS